MGDVVQQGMDNVITKLKDKQDGAIIITFRNKEIFGVYILLNLIVFLWGGFEDHSSNPVCLVWREVSDGTETVKRYCWIFCSK